MLDVALARLDELNTRLLSVRLLSDRRSNSSDIVLGSRSTDQIKASTASPSSHVEQRNF